ncbi:hypothetical protein [Lysinibacillus xylanilyticus]|uniref:hypothetical protein n=1 Tax=Lysinibacillus xylanilyticus TaxID=582475 RepID=UPI003D02ECAF
MMAYKHEFSETLFKIVREFYEDKGMLQNVHINYELYRGRKRSKDNTQYNINEMGMPPKGVSSHGRYNLIGTSVLYLTTSKFGIPYEIEPKKNEVCRYR